MICPSCKKDVPISERDYGALFTCSNCQAVYFVNFSGEPEFENVDPQSYEIWQKEQAQQELKETTGSSGSSGSSLPQIASPQLTQPFEAQAFESQPVATPSFEIPAVLTQDPFQLNQSANDQSLTNSNHGDASSFEASPHDFSLNHLSQEQIKTEESMHSSEFNSVFNNSESTPQSMQNFANKETSFTSLKYNVMVYDLDIKSNYLKFKEALTDQKLNIDFEALTPVNNEGVVYLKQLNAIQAYILITRFQQLQLITKWESHVLE